MRRKTAAVLFASLLPLACSSDDSSSQNPETEPRAGLAFDASPDTNFSVADCNKNPNSWTIIIDSMPDQAMAPDEAQTIGMVREYDENNDPVIEIGATVLGHGGYVYEIATSDKTDKDPVIDLNDGSWAQVIEAEDDTGYAATLSAMIDKKGTASFVLNCRPEYDFSGDGEQAPLEPIPYADEYGPV